MKTIKWFMLGLTVVFSAVMLGVLPEKIPVHFDIYGNPDRYGSKFEILIITVIVIALLVVSELIKRSFCKRAERTDDDKKKKELLSNVKVLEITMLITGIMLFVINIIYLYTTYSMANPKLGLPEIEMNSVLAILMGLTFIILGNYMPKTRKNSNIGFRLYWTMYNEITWKKSNRFASYVMMIAGVISVVVGFFAKSIVAMIVLLASLLIAILIMTVYAYIVYREERAKEDGKIDKE